MQISKIPLKSEEEIQQEQVEALHKYIDSPEGLHAIKAATTPWKRMYPKIGMNELCPCGSGKKYKRCCHLTNLPRYTVDYE